MDQPEHNHFGRGWVPLSRDIGLPGENQPPVTYTAGPFTPERQVAFLGHLARHGNARVACAAVGLSPQSAYVHRRRDAAFARGWEGALVLARQHVEQVLADRALNGVTETIYYRGEAVGHRTRFDTRLLLAHMARLDRHCESAPSRCATAARFDEVLDALLAGGLGIETPSRAEAIAAAEIAAEQAFPEDLADLDPQTLGLLADLAAQPTPDEGDESDLPDPIDPDVLWTHAFALARAEARLHAAAEWDAQARARHARIDRLHPDHPVAELLPEPCQRRQPEPAARILTG